jgi:shikimate dehydrogenase
MRRACVIGWPVAHSRSPLIHGYWLRRHGIEGSYTRRPVRPDDVVSFLGGMREEGFVGCNVTLPYKETAYAVAARKEPAAQAVGAANTLWHEGGRLVADNTDTAGFMAHLHASAPELRLAGRAAAVLGAGGAARAVVFGLLDAGVGEVRVFNRTAERGARLAQHFGAKAKAYPWGERCDRARDVALLVNATSLGMKGGGWLEMDVGGLAADCVVADLVYAPLETELLAAARARGLAAVDGLGMLLHQAVPGFEKWFGVRPAVTEELRELVLADLGGG